MEAKRLLRKYKDMKIEFKVFDFGKWYDTACFNILPVHMHRLKQIYNVIGNILQLTTLKPTEFIPPLLQLKIYTLH